MARTYDKQNKKFIALEKEISDLKREYELLNEKYQILEELRHETGRLCAEVLSQSELLCHTLEKPSSSSSARDKPKEISNTIIHTASMISARMLYTNIELNPETLAQTPTVNAGIYKKFDKSNRVLGSFSKSKSVNVQFDGLSNYTISVISAFDCVPFILLDNAIKYTNQSGHITVTFDEKLSRNPKLIVKISSLGPKVNKEDLLKLCDRGYQDRDNSDGQGLGLYIAKQLCNIYGIKIEFDSEQINTFIMNGIEYSTFTVTLTFE